MCSFLSTRAVEWKIATWGLFIKGKFRSSQMCSNFSRQLKQHNSHKRIIPAVRQRFVNTCRNLSFLSQFFLLSPTTRQKITLADSQVFLFCSSYTLTLVSLANFICLSSRCQNYKKQQVFSNLLNHFEIIFTVNMDCAAWKWLFRFVLITSLSDKS